MKKTNLVLVTISFLLVVTIISSCASWKHPLTVEYFDAKWHSLEDTTGATYYREIRYDENRLPVGTVTDYYMSGVKQWEGKVFRLKPFKGEGECKRYYENGNIKNIEYWVEGQRHGMNSSFNEENGKLEMNLFYQRDTFLVAGYEGLSQFVKNKDFNELLLIKQGLLDAYYKEKSKKYKQAALALEDVTLKYPNYSYPIEKKAYFHFISMDYELAKKEYGKLLSTNYPEKTNAKIQQLISNYKTENYDNTIKLANEILSKIDTSAIGEIGLAKIEGYKGLSYMNQDLPDIGEVLLRKSREIKLVPDVLYEHAKYYTGKHNYAASNEVLDYAISVINNFPEYYGLRSLNYYRLGNYNQSRRDHNYYLRISSKQFTNIDPELIVSIDLSNDLSRLGKDLFDSYAGLQNQWGSFSRREPIIAWGIKTYAKWFWKEINK